MRRSHSAELIGDSSAITEAREEIARVARSDAKVLITVAPNRTKLVLRRVDLK